MAFDVDRHFALLLPVIADVPPLDQERNKGGGVHILILYRETIRNKACCSAGGDSHQDLEVNSLNYFLHNFYSLCTSRVHQCDIPRYFKVPNHHVGPCA